MLKFIQQYVHLPLDAIVRSRYWLESEFKFIRTGDPMFRNVCDVFQSEIAKMSISELEEFWVSREYVFWLDEDYCRDGCLYLQLDESIEVADQFLLHQLDGIDELVFQFLNNLKQVLNREIPKKNCIEVIAPPTSGKNWFFDVILTFCITHGQIMNAKGSNQFPMDNCFNKRVLFFNEPNFENSFYDLQ
jgi:hypothetical protein